MTTVPVKPAFPYPARRALPLARGLQALFVFTEGAGTKVFDAASGQSADVRGTSTWTNSHGGRALNQVAAGTNHVDTNRSSFGSTSLFAQAGEAFTVLLRADVTNSNAGLISRGSISTTATTLMIWWFSGTLYCYVRGTGTFLAGAVQSGLHDYAVTWDGTTARFYRDGVFVSNLNVGSQALQARDLIFGAIDSSAPSFVMGGTIDFAGVWDRALSETELKTLAHSKYQLAAPEPRQSLIPSFFGKGVNILTRWSGDRLPLASAEPGATRSAEVIGVADGEASSITEAKYVTRDADTIYHFGLQQLTPGGKYSPPRAEDVVTRVTGSNAKFLGHLPNAPSSIFASLLPGLLPRLQWTYSHYRDEAEPDHFGIWSAAKGAAFDFASDPDATVDYERGVRIYDWTGSVLSPADEMYYVVRAITAGGVKSLVPRRGKSPSPSYSSVDQLDAAFLHVPLEAPSPAAGLVAEAHT